MFIVCEFNIFIQYVSLGHYFFTFSLHVAIERIMFLLQLLQAKLPRICECTHVSCALLLRTRECARDGARTEAINSCGTRREEGFCNMSSSNGRSNRNSRNASWLNCILRRNPCGLHFQQEAELANLHFQQEPKFVELHLAFHEFR